MSLRARLLLGVALVGLALALAAISITRSTERHLIDQIDQQLARSAPEGPAGRRPGGSTFGLAERSQRVGGVPSSLYVAWVDARSGELVTAFRANLTTASSSAPAIDATAVEAKADTGPFTVDATDGALRYRAVVRATRGDQTVLYALPLEDVDESIRRLWLIQGAAAVAILGTLGLTTFWVLRLGVRPVQQMTETAKAIGGGELTRRIPHTVAGTEAGELGMALNQMLGRIEESFDQRTRSEERLRQFVADASHELRTPITTIGGYAELYRLGGLTERAALDEAMRRTEQESDRMAHLVADLLDLARLDQGRPLQLAPVDLAQLVRDSAGDLQAVAPDREVIVDAPATATIVADEGLLRQVLANLTTNARVHTPAGTSIELRVQASADHVALEIVDHGPGMAPDVAARAFERFYRADPARDRRSGGTGLGLAIVAAAVAAHEGSIELDATPGHGTRIRILVPTIPPAAPTA